jgi:hypothetical protein
MVLGFSLALALSPACGDEGGDESFEGCLGCVCYPNGTCDEGLTCIDGGCDVPGAGEITEGDACTETGAMACGRSTAGASDVALICNQAGTYEVAFECPGLQTCTGGLDHVDCGGTDYAVSGAPCATEDDQVCSIDGEVVLVCDNGEWIDGVHCPPSNCENVQSASAWCSGHWCANCGYTPGDVCGFQAGGVNCSTDLTSIVQCSNGTVTVFEECAAGTTCTQMPGMILGCA